MRASITALTEELKRLKATGVRSVSIAPESIARLRAAVENRAAIQEPNPVVVPLPTALTSHPEPAIVTGGKEPATRVFPATPVPALPGGDKAARWSALREFVLQDVVCQQQVRPDKQVVFGVGDINATIMFVGEAPGAEEELQGEPFVGPAGQLLDKMIAAMGLKRSETYIGNIMSWRPAMPLSTSGEQFGNRPPTVAEMAYCLPFLKLQIEIVDPQVIVALGATAAQGLLGPGSFRTLGEVRGRWKEFSGKPLLVTYHPSYILRNQSNRSKRMIWEDLLQVMERVALPISDRQRGYFLEK